MLVRDIDKKLDMRLVLKLRQNIEFFDATNDIDVKLPVYIFRSQDNTTWMSVYFPKDAKNPRISLILKKFKAVSKEDTSVIDTRINNVKDLAVIEKLMDLPSFVINRSDMSKGFLYVYARFHHSDLPRVSNLLSQYTSDKDNSRVQWLGPSPGIMKIADLVNSEYPISFVTYTVKVSRRTRVLYELSKEHGIIAEVKNARSKKHGFSVILYSDHDLTGKINGVKQISAGDMIYEADIKNRFLELVRDASNKEHIMRMRYFVRPQDGAIDVTVFLPTGSIYEYYSILFEVARNNRTMFTVKTLMPYSPDVWEFL